MLPARYYARLAALLEARGVARRALLRRARLPLRRLADPHGGLRLAEVERLSAAALALAPRPGLGWEVGALISAAEHPALGQALLYSASLEQALRLAVRYFSLLSPGFVLRYHPGPVHGTIEVLPRLPFGPQALRLHLDAILAGLLTELTRLCGGPLPRLWIRCALTAAPGALTPALLRRHRCESGVGGVPGFRLQLPTALLRAARELPGGQRAAPARFGLEAERERIGRGVRLGDWTRMMLREAQDGLPAQRELAELCGLSVRSFARRLSAEGEGFRELVKAARIERACVALRQTETRVTALALTLGYRDAANFSRAFRRATGVSPRAFRRGPQR